MIHELLTRTQTELSTLAATGLSNAGPTLGELTTLADELAAARLGRLGERLRAIGQAGDDHARTAAWAAAWAGVGLVRTRLLRPLTPDLGDVLALPQASNVVFPRPAGDLDGVDGLLTVLQSADPMARAYAAGRLAEFGDEAVPGLLALQKTCGRCIRFLAIEALARIGTDGALAGLVGLLGDGDVARPLEAALLGLGERAAEPVANALAQPKVKDKRRRQAAAKLLWRLGPAERLRTCLDDGDELVQAYAQAALWSDTRLAERTEQQRSGASIPAAVALFERSLVTAASLVERLDALTKNHLADAAAALWHTPAEPPVLAHYLAQISVGYRSQDRQRAAALVAHLANPEALGALLRVSEQDTGLVVGALAELGDSTATWPLLGYAEQSTGYWQNMIIPALGRIGDPAAAPYLVATLRAAHSTSTGESAEKALIEIGSPAVGVVGRELLRPEPGLQKLAPLLERVLTAIKTPEAQAILQSYRTGTDELTQLLLRLADRKSARQAIDQVVRLGQGALQPLLGMVIADDRIGKANAALALARLAPLLTEEQRELAVRVLTGQLGAQKYHGNVGMAWQGNSVVEALVRSLCELDASSALPEIQSALVFLKVDDILVEFWGRSQRAWLLDAIVQGIQAPQTRFHALLAVKKLPRDAEMIRRLWSPVTAIIQTETDLNVLGSAVSCLHFWADPKAVPLLRGLAKRLAAVTGSDWQKRNLGRQLDAALTELNKKRSLKDRLLGT